VSQLNHDTRGGGKASQGGGEAPQQKRKEGKKKKERGLTPTMVSGWSRKNYLKRTGFEEAGDEKRITAKNLPRD